jgi:hypothetical protein
MDIRVGMDQKLDALKTNKYEFEKIKNKVFWRNFFRNNSSLN